jgi:hypothetical protein
MEDGVERPDNAALIAVAAEAGHTVSARSLELWRYRGLLPRPERGAGAEAGWRYPVGTERQLSRLLHWRSHARGHDGILIALWIEGFDIDPDRVREALGRFVDLWIGMIEAETKKVDGEDESEMVDRLARQLARMRGEAALPRAVRMRLAEREAACGYLVAALLGMKEEVRRREADLLHLERMLGMRSGHGGGVSATFGLRDIDGELDLLPSPREVRAAIDESTAPEFELVRRLVGTIVVWIPLALPMLFADQPVKAAHLLQLTQEMLADPPPAALAFLVAVSLTLLHAKDPAMKDLEHHLGALSRRPSVELLDPP